MRSSSGKSEKPSDLILPKKMLEHLRVKEGQQLFVIETPSGYSLAALDKGMRKQIKVGEAFLDRYCGVFDELAKQKNLSDSR